MSGGGESIEVVRGAVDERRAEQILALWAKHGALEGDFVVVRPTERARDGEIVVALLGDEATVKRFFREKDQVRLQPENKSMKPIRTRDVRLLGRVIGVFRRVS